MCSLDSQRDLYDTFRRPFRFSEEHYINVVFTISIQFNRRAPVKDRAAFSLGSDAKRRSIVFILRRFSCVANGADRESPGEIRRGGDRAASLTRADEAEEDVRARTRGGEQTCPPINCSRFRPACIGLQIVRGDIFGGNPESGRAAVRASFAVYFRERVARIFVNPFSREAGLVSPAPRRRFPIQRRMPYNN